MSHVVVITGAGGVLCSAFAKTMASQGYAVALLDLNRDAAQAVADEINARAAKRPPTKPMCWIRKISKRCMNRS